MEERSEKGESVFFIIDTLVNLLVSFIVPVNSYDGTTVAKYLINTHQINWLFNNIQLTFAGSTFGGTFHNQMKNGYDIEVVMPKILIVKRENVQVLEKRWIVERSITWTLKNRRCSKDYERKIQNVNAFMILTSI